MSGKVSSVSSKFKLTRRGRKLQISDDPRILQALPKDVPERTWAEILQKEENYLICFEVREEIIEEALQIGYDNFMERQTAPFTVHCAELAWLKLIDWNFYRHDPGEEPSAYPPCYIPKREESWIPDDPPEPSPKDTWGLHELEVVSECQELVTPKLVSSTSLDYPVVAEIPKEYWFPGKIRTSTLAEELGEAESEEEKNKIKNASWRSDESLNSGSGPVGTDSEMVQKVTDYGPPAPSEDTRLDVIGVNGDNKRMTMDMEPDSLPDSVLRGAGDAERMKKQKNFKNKSGFWSRSSMGKCRGVLPPLLGNSQSQLTNISDCRLRNLRMETQYELSSETIDSFKLDPPKRK